MHFKKEVSTPTNVIQVLDTIRRGKNTFSKKHIRNETGIAWGTICKTADSLERYGFIASTRLKPAGRGRPNILLDIKPDAAYFAGIDIGANFTKVIICDLAFNIAYKEVHPTPSYESERQFLDWLTGIYRHAVESPKIPHVKISGLGVAVSGAVDSELGMIVSGGNFGLKRESALSIQKLVPRCKTRVCAVSTQVAAAWAEYNFGQQAGCKNLVTIGIGVGIGSGVVLHGQIVPSHPERQVGYIGHMLIPGNSRTCVCGFKGCLEAYSGGNSLAAIARETFPKRADLKTAAELDVAAANGDSGARAILTKAAVYNAAGVASMIQLYAPNALIFSGGQSRQNGFLFTQTLQELNEMLPKERWQHISVSLTTLGSYQSALGAARLAYEKFIVPAPKSAH